MHRRYKISMGTPLSGALDTRGWEKFAILTFISEEVQDRPTVTVVTNTL